jgi:hypothetical protein
MAVSGRTPDLDGPDKARPPYLRGDGLFAYERIVGLEARAGWALGPGLAAFLPPDATPNEVLIPFLIEPGDNHAVAATLEFVEAVLTRPDSTLGPYAPGLRAPIGPHNGERLLEVGEIYTMALSPVYFFELAVPETTPAFQAFRTAFKRIELSLPMRALAIP